MGYDRREDKGGGKEKEGKESIFYFSYFKYSFYFVFFFLQISYTKSLLFNTMICTAESVICPSERVNRDGRFTR